MTQTDAKSDVTKSEPQFEEILVKLDEADVIAAGAELADNFVAKAKLEAQGAEDRKLLRTKISVHDEAIEEISEAINYGVPREIECFWELNWNEEIKTLIRVDSGEEIRSVKISPEDRQMHIAVVNN